MHNHSEVSVVHGTLPSFNACHASVAKYVISLNAGRIFKTSAFSLGHPFS
jgi:hypothetical protein